MINSIEKLFKGIVLISYVTYLTWFFMPFIPSGFYDQETMDALTWAGYGSSFIGFSFIPYVILIAYSVVTAGLLLCDRHNGVQYVDFFRGYTNIAVRSRDILDFP